MKENDEDDNDDVDANVPLLQDYVKPCGWRSAIHIHSSKVLQSLLPKYSSRSHRKVLATIEIERREAAYPLG